MVDKNIEQINVIASTPQENEKTKVNIDEVSKAPKWCQFQISKCFSHYHLKKAKENIVQWLHDVGAVGWIGHKLDVIAQHVLQKRAIINVTLIPVNEKQMSSIQQSI